MKKYLEIYFKIWKKSWKYHGIFVSPKKWEPCSVKRFPIISCLKCTVNLYFHLFRRKALPTNDCELTVPTCISSLRWSWLLCS